MTHLNLISTLYKNREIIDEVYKHDRDRLFLSGVDEVLFKAGILKSFGKKVILNREYRTFIDSSLYKMSRNIKFDDYRADLDSLIDSNEQFIATQKVFFKQSTLLIIEELYEKIDSQDRKIKSIVDNITLELSFDIDILIHQTKRLLDELESLLSATNRVSSTLNERIIADIDEEIDRDSKELLFNIEIYIENIERYCSQTSEILTMSKSKKAQNKRLLKLANMIFNDDSSILDNYLKINRDRLLINNSQKIYSNYESEVKIIEALQSFLDTPLKKVKPKKIKIKAPKEEKISYIDLDILIDDLNKNGCEDLFYFIKNHNSTQEYFREFEDSKELLESVFVSFLTLVIPSNAHLIFAKESEFNNDNIRIVKWKREID